MTPKEHYGNVKHQYELLSECVRINVPHNDKYYDAIDCLDLFMTNIEEALFPKLEQCDDCYLHGRCYDELQLPYDNCVNYISNI